MKIFFSKKIGLLASQNCFLGSQATMMGKRISRIYSAFNNEIGFRKREGSDNVLVLF